MNSYSIVVIIGEINVGKINIIKCLLGEEFFYVNKSNIGADFT